MHQPIGFVEAQRPVSDAALEVEVRGSVRLRIFGAAMMSPREAKLTRQREAALAALRQGSQRPSGKVDPLVKRLFLGCETGAPTPWSATRSKAWW